MTRNSVAAVVIAISMVAARPAAGQSIGASLAGVVHDESGARLPGVIFTLTNTANGRTQTVISDARGEFRAVALQPAPYRLAADHSGFARLEQDVTLNVGSELTIDVQLTVAGVRETVTVGATISPAVAKSQPSALVSAEDIESLPEIGRNFLVTAQLLPGSGPLNSTVGRYATTRFGGMADQRSGFTTLVDGGDVDDAQWGSPVINLTQEAVQEFKVFRHQFDAQYGSALGAVVSVVTRAGGNQLDGSVFYFGRDDTLNARNVFADRNPPFDEQRLGVTMGGPLVRDRVYLFGAFERDRVDTVRIIALPPSNPFAARENGVFPAQSNERMAVLRADHRISPAHAVFLRYVHDDQTSIRINGSPSSDSGQVDTFSRAHSIVGEVASSLSSRALNTLRAHWFSHTTGGIPHTLERTPGVQRPSVTTGQTLFEWQTLWRTRVVLSDAVFMSNGNHDLKFGGDIAFGNHRLDSHYLEDGMFTFSTDAPFDPAVQSTWPTLFQQQPPNVQTYNAWQLSVFAQDDWRAASRLRLNLGLRYDLDPTLRINDFYERMLSSPTLAGLDRFVSNNRGTDTNNVQPRIGATFDLRGNGSAVLRGGWGMYVSRNRPWFQIRSMNQLAAPMVVVEDPTRLRLYPDIAAILAGGAPVSLGTIIPDDFVQAYAMNTTGGIGWQLGPRASLDVDYVHSYGTHQAGFIDRNLPAAGAISPTNPRPVSEFAQALMLENYTKSWYDALESQFRATVAGAGRLQASYTFSRSYLDGVEFFNIVPGTQRTPRERGYNPSDQRHNLTAAATFPLPGQLQLSGIVKLISGSPMPVQAGFDLDGDRSPTSDRPEGLPITVGREDEENALRQINALRATLGTAARPLAAISAELLRLDPYRTLDLRLTKFVQMGGRRGLELTLEAFNVTNYVNYNSVTVNRNINSAAFLQRRSARSARQIQWGLRYVF
jgi:hypothetical protein